MPASSPSRNWFRLFGCCLGFGSLTDSVSAVDWQCRRTAATQQWDCEAPRDHRAGLKADLRQGPRPTAGELPRLTPEGSRGLAVAVAKGIPPAAGRDSVAGVADPAAAETPPAVPSGDPASPGNAVAEKKSPVSGWDCRPAAVEEEADEQGWNCVRLGSATPPGDWRQADTFTREDEQRFQQMLGQFPVNPWKNACSGLLRPPPLKDFLVTRADELARTKAPTQIEANHFEMLDDEIINFSGNASLTRADQKITGDFLSRNAAANTVNAHGSVFYHEKGLAVASDAAFLRNNTDQGVFRNAQFLLPAVPARGTSRLAFKDSSTLSRYETFTYSACPPGNDDWLLHASHVKIDKESGVGTARNAWVEFKGVPFFYTPYMSFPVDDRRQSGFLSPSFGTSTVSGVSLQIPYYFNLAPNLDYTATPRYLFKRGFQLKNEFRYLTEMTRGRIYGDVVPHDDETGTTRGQVGVLNDTRFTERLTGRINANYVSDPLYLNQLGSQLALVDRSNIPSLGYLLYSGNNYSLRTQIDYFQTIDPTIIAANGQPFFHLPQIAFNYSSGLFDSGVQFDGPVQIDSFQTAANNKTTGQRLKLRPRLYYPLTAAAGYLIPSVALQHNQYWLQDPEDWGTANGVTTGTSESFTVPVMSLDSGLYFDREFEWSDAPMVHTLEPRIFYNYIPFTNQTKIPVFDSAIYDFTFYQMFRENRFTGSDRVGDTNQVTVALTSRVLEEAKGMERLRGSLGSVFYFRDRLVTLDNVGYSPNYNPTPQSTQLQSTSNLIGDVGLGITEAWKFHTGGQWNPAKNQIERGIVALQYNDNNNRLFNLAYRYRVNQTTLDCVKGQVYNGCLNLTDVSMRLPVISDWYLIGRWQYSILDQLTLESFGGIERETCCWRFAFLVRNYVNDYNYLTSTPISNFSVFLQVEFKGLAKSGNDVDQFLARSVSGFRYGEIY